MSVKPVVVGIDGSPDSVRALQWGAQYARYAEAPVHALIGWHSAPVYGYTAMVSWDDSDRLKEEAAQVLAQTVREALGDDAQVTERVEQGHPSEALVKASEEAQLVVVGSRGHGGFTGMLLGSVSQHCVTHARCPVTVMSHDAAQER